MAAVILQISLFYGLMPQQILDNSYTIYVIIVFYENEQYPTIIRGSFSPPLAEKSMDIESVSTAFFIVLA